MTLRRQLLLVSLLLLSLPWAGCQFIREMEDALRQGQAQSLQATAEAVAAVAGSEEGEMYPNATRRGAEIDERRALYAFPAQGQVIVDGYGDSWEDIPGRTFRDSTSEESLSVEVRAQTREKYLYLLFIVTDEKVVYHNPGLSTQANGDRLILRLWHNDGRQDYVVATAAPGSVRARADGRRHRGLDAARISGYWQDAMDGYSLELEVPLAYTGGRLGFFFIDEDKNTPRGDRSVGNTTRLESSPPPWLLYHPRELQLALASFRGREQHIQVVDKTQWLLADLPGATGKSSREAETFWLLRLVYRSILSQDELVPPPDTSRPGKLAGDEIDAALAGNTTTHRYRDPNDMSRTILSTATPVHDERGVVGAVVVRQSAETYLSLTDQAFSRLLGYSLMALAVGALGMLAYASVLSWRIGSLSRAATNAVTEDGRVTGAFTASAARDEIGDLSRQYNNLLARLKEYNDYLHTLSRKLAHELRTPIAVIQSSLDNLEHAEDAAAQATYLPRAREGLARLQYILTAMSEANRLEESVQNHERVRLDLVPLLQELFDAYQGVYSEHNLNLTMDYTAAAWIEGVPELLVQALDKLMTNAASFAPPEADIELQLAACDSGWALRVLNEGPPLDPGSREKMFDPMVSVRDKPEDNVHLGLGLHIVRLIVDFHRGTVRAFNLTDNRGVVVEIRLPRAEDVLSPQTPAV